ncbi:2-octaprenyl-6-methoxyphenyl hydroxylase [Thalassotalea sp. M1531]|uniref:2-octaprenyl-6-methoxyphenyl hydroxylase n=1 Tax=Thalassotalea algicola TaxID=2716224 RepID=A0A7Y0LAZ4_9GAMM|nr:2-octaprenyl-6-methoxyphenyl hydroxylase [Thalassotalea algicola]NMP31106.1 2-octaprenyl-6-methoxyphenyl hydroxylase [Thalassotalea algicola]
MSESETTSADSTTIAYDVVIVGGGLSGLLTAVSLIENKSDASSIKLAIIEANAIKPSQQNEFDDRVLALSHGSVEYLKSLSVWQLMAGDATPIEQIHISDRGNYGKARIKAANHSVEALGYVIPLASIANGLLIHLEAIDAIDWLAPATIEAIDYQQEQVSIQLVDEATISTKLLVACDGGQSICRKAANISSIQTEYQQHAVIANVITEKPHQNQAFERFTEQGPIAMLPMSGNQCSLVWTLEPELAQSISKLDEQSFCLALEQAFGGWLGSIKQSSRRVVFPLALIAAESQTFHRMALVGNASHTIHPIAGQGFNLGLRDVKVLSRLITQALNNQEDIGAGQILNQYQESRQQDQSAIIRLTDSMVTLFSNDLPPLVAGRNVGLKVMNYLTPLQKAFVNKTMGY